MGQRAAHSRGRPRHQGLFPAPRNAVAERGYIPVNVNRYLLDVVYQYSFTVCFKQIKRQETEIGLVRLKLKPLQI